MICTLHGEDRYVIVPPVRKHGKWLSRCGISQYQMEHISCGWFLKGLTDKLWVGLKGENYAPPQRPARHGLDALALALATGTHVVCACVHVFLSMYCNRQQSDLHCRQLCKPAHFKDTNDFFPEGFCNTQRGFAAHGYITAR